MWVWVLQLAGGDGAHPDRSDRLTVKKTVVPVWPFFWRVVIHDATTGVWLTGYFGRATSRADAERRIAEKVERTRQHKGAYGS